MADMESMYYQVHVPENQQTYLKFLWWENHDIECHPQEFVMCAHLFGGTSSGGCSNYALRRTAVDNEAEFGRAAASTLLKNFCVDEFLKSVGNINIAKQLVKDVISMLLDVMSFKARADCSCFISKNGMFVQERI